MNPDPDMARLTLEVWRVGFAIMAAWTMVVIAVLFLAWTVAGAADRIVAVFTKAATNDDA